MAAASPLADQGAIVARLDKSAVRSWGRFRVGGPRAARGGRQLLAEWSRLAFANERPVCTSLLTYGSSWRCARHGSDIEPIEVVIHPLSCLPPQIFSAPMRCRAPVIAAAHYTFMHTVLSRTRAAHRSLPGRTALLPEILLSE